MRYLLRFRSLALPFLSASVFASAAALGSAATPAPKAKPGPKPAAHTALAPADRYFGPNKMSIVGMRTAIVNLGQRYHAREIEDGDIVHDASLVESALYLWHDKYPKDMDAIVTAYKLEQLYQAVQSDEARGRATGVLKFIAKAAPKSQLAHVSRLRLAQGFPPLTVETATHATPNPYTQEAGAGASSAPVASSTTAADMQADALPAAAPGSAASPAPALSPVASSSTGAPASSATAGAHS